MPARSLRIIFSVTLEVLGGLRGVEGRERQLAGLGAIVVAA